MQEDIHRRRSSLSLLLAPCLAVAAFAATSAWAQTTATVANQPDQAAAGATVPEQVAQLSAPAPGTPQVPNSPAVPQQIQPSPPQNLDSGIPPAPLSPRISLLTDQVPFEVGKGIKLGRYYSIRSEEDFSYLRDPAKSNDLFDPLKFVRLNPEGTAYITFNGEERLRYEYYTKNSFTFVPPEHQSFSLFRHAYGADLHLDEHFRAYASLISGQVGGANYGRPPSVNRSDLEVQQAFGEVMGRVGSAQAGLRVGRQEFFFGSGVFFSTREPTNIRQSFDGFRAYVNTYDLRVDAFAVDGVINRYGVLQESSNAHQNFWGFYATKGTPISNIFGVPARLFVDPTYIGTRNRMSTFLGFRGEERHTLGARLWGQIGSADIDWTGAYQFGSQGAADVSAHAVFTNTGYTFSSAPVKPRIGLRLDMATGGRTGNTLHTYDPLVFANGYLTEASVLAAINFYDLGLGVSFSPTDRLRVSTYFLTYWRYAQNDGVYSVVYTPFRNTTAVRGTPIGTQPAIRAAYVVNPHLTLSGALAFFRVDAALRNAGAKDNLFALTQAQFRF